VTGPRILVVGAGSIGTRHARNFQALGAIVEVTDPDTGRAADCGAGTPVADGLAHPDNYDGIVLASPTALHAEQLWAASTRPVLVEKPVARRSADLDGLPADAAVMVGYNLRFHEPVQRLMSMVHAGEAGNIVGARLWFGSHLPDWRPGVDYTTTYSARAELGGGVLLDAIHELDLLLWLFSEHDDATFAVAGAVVARVGSLDIDVEDTVRAVLTHRQGTSALIELDYLSRRYRRGIEVLGDRATLRLDWARAVIEREDGDGVTTWPAATDVAESYRREATCFMSWLGGGADPPVDLETGLASLRLAERVRAQGEARNDRRTV